MADEVFRQSRKKITPDELRDTPGENSNPLDQIKSIQQAVAKETGRDVPQPFEAPFQIEGNIPPEFRSALMRKAQQGGMPEPRPVAPKKPEDDENFETFEAPPDKPRPHVTNKQRATPDAKIRVQGTDALEGLLQKLADKHQWEQFTWPSKGKFYTDIPETVHVRTMTGEEEQILSTPRWVKKGLAIDMIFRRCIRETIDTEQLLSVDRTNLLIFLRGISYTPEYDVEIKCPSCSIKFAHVIDLNDLEIDVCPDDFGPDRLRGKLPVSKFNYSYRLATGADDQEVTNYRERRIGQWGDQGEDDTLLYRTALLLDEIEGVSMKKELAVLLKKLPIQDVGHLRNEINQPPFGVDTMIPILCPNGGCSEEFKIDLPMEANFFFPRKKEPRNQV
jgi:hypothetical protein